MYQVFITGYHLAEVLQGKPYYVYTVEMVDSSNGARYLTERRYSEFNALHRTLKKESDITAPFPPKRVRNSNPKVLEQRRTALEQYMQKMLKLSSTKQQVLNFLGIDDKDTKGANKRTQRVSRDEKLCHPSHLGHHPVLTFQCDPYVRNHVTTNLPDIVTNGVLLGVYKS